MASLVLWVTIDLASRSRHDLRDFDGHEVARLETAMWRSYYDHHSVQLFRELAELLRRQYHLPFWQSNITAFHAARAAVVFQRGHGRSDYLLALPDLESFYARIEQHSTAPFDVDNVARLELEWWIIHRERAQHAPSDLESALAALQSGIYRRPAGEFQDHAKARADAMLLRDARAETGGSPSETDWRTIATLLDQSWVGLHTVVSASR
jgi:hypothetical protein